MKEKLVSAEVSKIIKNIGFDIGTRMNYSEDYDNNGNEINELVEYECNSTTPAPTQSLLQKWLREEHEVYVDVESLFKNNKIVFSVDIVYFISTLHVKSIKNRFETYEEALELGLEEALKLI